MSFDNLFSRGDYYGGISPAHLWFVLFLWIIAMLVLPLIAWSRTERGTAVFTKVARAIGKPLVVGEFGLRNDGPLDLPARRAVYRGWLECLRRGGGAAAGVWMLAHDDRPESWDAYTFKWWNGTPAEDPANSYVDVLRDAAAAW